MTPHRPSLEDTRNHVARALAALPDGNDQPARIREAIGKLRSDLKEAWRDAEAIRGALVLLSGETLALRGRVIRLAQVGDVSRVVEEESGSQTVEEGPRCGR